MASTEWSVRYCCLRLPRIQPDLNSKSLYLEQRSAAEVYFCLQRELQLPFFNHPENHEPGHPRARNSDQVPGALWRLLSDGVTGNWTHDANEGNVEVGD